MVGEILGRCNTKTSPARWQMADQVGNTSFFCDEQTPGQSSSWVLYVSSSNYSHCHYYREYMME